MKVEAQLSLARALDLFRIFDGTSKIKIRSKKTNDIRIP